MQLNSRCEGGQTVFRMEFNLMPFCLSQVEIFQYKHLQDFAEIVSSGFVKVFFCVLHGMPYCRKRGWNQM